MKKTSLATLLLMGGGVMGLPQTQAQTQNPADAQEQQQQPVGRYIIVYREPAIASYKGDIGGIPAPARDQRGALMVTGTRAAGKGAYAQHLHSMQRQHETALSRTIGRNPVVKQRMYHAVNGAVIELTEAEAQRIQQMPDVVLVESYREYELDTDRGPELIGAPELWGSAQSSRDRLTAPRSSGARGEGIVVGILDTGINFGSPSFSAVASDGYRHLNPQGTGNYLGSCAPGGVDEGRCNDKLIGGYDFVCGEPTNACELSGAREEPGFGDNAGHGSHTASTAAGNPRTAMYAGNAINISGVAPRANIIAYDVCYEHATRGGCPNTATAAAVDQAVQDGVDVINYSIGGGSSPWTSSTSLAFLGAVDAGVTVVTSAGNDGPDPATVGHQEPWTISTAAAQHGRGSFEFLLDVTGPGTPPQQVRNVVLTQGSGGVAHTASIPANTPLSVSPGFASGSDACEPYAGPTFNGGIALIRRGGCSFSSKVNHASSAGARAVVIANNGTGGLTPSVPGTEVPVFAVSQEAGDALSGFAIGREATAGISYPAVASENVADALAGFSSRGPTFYDLLKPDISAPGVSVLAADSGAEIEGHEDLVGLKSGTSMASPHVAGVAALLSQLHPDWTPSEIKSAIMMTSTPLVLLQDEQTPADPFAMGAGRVQAPEANGAWLLMDETTADFLGANPAQGGDVSQLNTPSMTNDSCATGCSFTRTLRNPLNRDIQWKARVEGIPGSVSPASFTVKRGAEIKVTVTVDASAIDNVDAWSHGQLVLEPQLRGRALNNTHQMPISVFVPAPAIATLPEEGIDMTLAAGQRGDANIAVLNVGGGVLEWQQQVDGSVSLPVHASTREGVTSGNRSTFFTDRNTGTFASDDFTVAAPVQLDHLSVSGFVVSGKAVDSVTDRITWAIYPDAGGVPAGDPITSPEAAIWSYTTAATGPGMRVNGERLEFNPIAAGQTVNLPAGTYWLVTHMDTAFADRWAWYYSNRVSGHPAQSVASPSASNRWAAIGDYPGMTFEVAGISQCGASWLGAMTPSTGNTAAGEQTAAAINVDSNGLAAGQYLGQACISSNDPTMPVTAVPVRLQVAE